MQESSDRHFKSPHMTKRARDLRRDATFPERLLWGILRGGKLHGLKFRRQHAIGRYVADFFCHEHSLVIELDGMSHVDKMDDDERQQWLEQQGYRVIRFMNDDVLHHLEVVADAIAREAGVQ